MQAWPGRVFWGHMWALYAGPVGPTALHRHHASQVVHAPGVAVADGSGTVVDGPAAIPANATHRLVGHGAGVVLLVEPRLPAAASEAVVAAACLPPAPPAPPGTWDEAAALVERLAAAAGWVLPSGRAVSAPVGAALRALGAAPGALADVAAAVGYSPSRLSHRFSAEVGLSFRAYRRWAMLVRAARAVEAGATLTDAAHHGGFADLPHLHRVFRATFGLRPSDLLGQAAWVTPA